MSNAQNSELASRLIYLLKRTQAQMENLNDRALAPIGINSRELAVLIAIAGGEPTSQQQLAERLGVDRTTMVALLDMLEGKGIVSRHPHSDDRRRNIVELTDKGNNTLENGVLASNQAEHTLLGSLSPEAATALRESLRTIVNHPTRLR
ncbi:MarR family transcriptional regulator [Glaciihabitans sp. UYNi722]|uniref:MarR family winged helix-turn-helix transcriptional regulator n=1 Tax=Glaciihabitans sp. UYNi722 TaxID=3156344 RepID=UPI003399BD9A